MTRPRRVWPAMTPIGLLYIYAARADRLLWFGAAHNRGHTALDGFDILPGFRGTLVRDDYAGYTKYDRQLTAVQVCCSHLLGSLRGIGELDTDPYRVQRTWTDPPPQPCSTRKQPWTRPGPPAPPLWTPTNSPDCGASPNFDDHKCIRMQPDLSSP